MNSSIEEPRTRWREGIPSIRAASLAGFAFVALTVASLLLLRRQPRGDAESDAIADFYLDGGERSIALLGLNLSPFAVIAFL